jgi:hypothetical protein
MAGMHNQECAGKWKLLPMKLLLLLVKVQKFSFKIQCKFWYSKFKFSNMAVKLLKCKPELLVYLFNIMEHIAVDWMQMEMTSHWNGTKQSFVACQRKKYLKTHWHRDRNIFKVGKQVACYTGNKTLMDTEYSGWKNSKILFTPTTLCSWKSISPFQFQ